MSLMPMICPPRQPVLIDRTAGTAIGTLTLGGGNAACFDGNTAQASASGGLGGTASTADPKTDYIGKDWGSGVEKTLAGIKLYAPTDQSFSNIGAGEANNIKFEVYGSTDNFSASNVLIFDSGTPVADSVANVVTYLTGFTISTAYRYHRVAIICSGSAGNKRLNAAEVELYELL